MRDLMIVILLSLLGVSPSPADKRIELKDGGVLVVRKTGDVVHHDAAGNRVRMRDGEPMEAKDGTRYRMKNDSSRRQFSLEDSLNPNRSKTS